MRSVVDAKMGVKAAGGISKRSGAQALQQVHLF
jgi:deoxyribose-phosphate aldolase